MVEGHLISAHFFFFSLGVPNLRSFLFPVFIPHASRVHFFLFFFFFFFFFFGEVESPEYFTPVCGVQVFMPRASRVHFFCGSRSFCSLVLCLYPYP